LANLIYSNFDRSFLIWFRVVACFAANRYCSRVSRVEKFAVGSFTASSLVEASASKFGDELTDFSGHFGGRI
jgi:hypothetical protein